MSAVTLEITEGTLEYHGAALKRIEAYIRFRWGVRPVTYLVEGPGDWTPPLEPTTITTIERWHNDAWTATTLDPAPLGGVHVPGNTIYRLSGLVGHNTDPDQGEVVNMPVDVREAIDRLDRYYRIMKIEGSASGAFTTFKAQDMESGGVGDVGRDQPHNPFNLMSYGLTELSGRPANWKARALQYSGAADLLRPYRRLS